MILKHHRDYVELGVYNGTTERSDSRNVARLVSINIRHFLSTLASLYYIIILIISDLRLSIVKDSFFIYNQLVICRH